MRFDYLTADDFPPRSETMSDRDIAVRGGGMPVSPQPPVRIATFRFERTAAPPQPEPGVIYLPNGGKMMSFLCPSGSGGEVLIPVGWGAQVTIENDEVTLPPIEPWLGRPGYQIVRNRVVWA